MIDKILIGAGCLIAIYGLLGLVGIWLVPSVGQSRFYSPGMLTGRVKPTRINRTIMSLWFLSAGGYFALSSSSNRTLGYILFSAFVVCAVAVMIIQFRSVREA